MPNQEKIVIIGYGWVGQANALALTMIGYDVFYYDVVNPAHHYEENYYDVYKKIKTLSHPLEKDGENTWYLISVGDRVKEDGFQDISLIEKTSNLLKSAKGGVILRSTVLPKNLKKLNFDYYLPEFLHEKWAVEECLNPFYFVIGKNSKKTEPSFFQEWQERAYKTFCGTPEQASYIKYLSNIWNALRIAFVNEYGDAIGDVEGMESVQKIDRVMDFIFDKKNYLRYGRGYSGHCLPKDVLAFSNMDGIKNSFLLKAIYESNLAHQKLEKKHNLPEWFSGWAADEAYASGKMGYFSILWNKFNLSSSVQLVRKRLRFLTELIKNLIPDKSLFEIKSMWNSLAVKNARYFVDTKGTSSKDVNEFDLRDSGASDYQKYLVQDPMLVSILNDPNQDKALEIGCGIGRMTEFFRQHFDKVSGIDISEVMVESAKKRLANLSGVELKVGDGQALDFPDNYFDFCFSYQTFQHFPTEQVLFQNLKELHRTLKPGGIAKLHLRTGRGPYKWHWAYGVSVTPAAAKNIAENISFRFIKHQVVDSKGLWIWLEK